MLAVCWWVEEQWCWLGAGRWRNSGVGWVLVGGDILLQGVQEVCQKATVVFLVASRPDGGEELPHRYDSQYMMEFHLSWDRIFRPHTAEGIFKAVLCEP